MTNPPEASSVPLALTSVVASGLPADLGGPMANAFYDVPAVFNRRPDVAEMDALRGSDAHRHLSRAGYPEVTMEVHDRRLVIGHTNLDQLERGLSTVIATIVDTVSREALAEKDRFRESERRDSDERAVRAQTVTRAAERVRFVPEPVDARTVVFTAAAKPSD